MPAPLIAKVDVALAAANEIVAAPGAGYRVRVLGYLIVAAGAVVATWKSATTTLTGAMTMTTGVPLAQLSPVSEGIRQPILVCAANEALNLTLGSAVQVSGHVLYDVEQTS